MQRLWFGLVLVTLGTMVAWAEVPANRVEKTTNQSQALLENFLNEQIIELTVHKTDRFGTAVFIRSKGRLLKDVVVEGMQNFSPVFVLYGKEPCRLLDHHSSTTFHISKIKEDSIVFFYRASFDHNSFGKNLTTIDEGEIEIKLRHPSN